MKATKKERAQTYLWSTFFGCLLRAFSGMVGHSYILCTVGIPKPHILNTAFLVTIFTSDWTQKGESKVHKALFTIV